MKRILYCLIGSILCLVAAFFVGSVRAQALPTVIGVHTVSVHMERGEGRGWNNSNPGVYMRWDNGLTVGTYRNSLYKQSAYLGWTLVDKTDTLAVTLGVVSGYDKVVSRGGRREFRCDNGCRWVQVKEVILPMVVPSVRIGITQSLSLRLAVVATPKAPPAAHLMVEYRL